MKKMLKKLAIIMAIIFSLNIVNAVTIIEPPEESETTNVNNGNSGVETSKGLPVVQVAVDSKGLRTDGTNNVIDPNENILTRVSDLLLNGDKMYTYDSVTSNDLHGIKPGDTVTGDMGCIIKDSNGKDINKLEVTAQIFINVSKEDVASEIYQKFQGTYDLIGMTENDIRETIVANDDFVSSTYGSYLTQEFNIELTFNNDGKFAVKLPKNVPDNYLLAFTKIEDPITGEMIDISKYYRLFIALGDGGNSNGGNPGEPGNPDEPGNPENPGNPGNPDITEKNEDQGYRSCSLEIIEKDYINMIPELSASISSEKYDVSQGIPTSENLTYSITADKSLYDIKTRNIVANAGVKNIKIQIRAGYRDGEKIKYVYKTVNSNFTYNIDTVSVFDVPVSDVFPVQEGTLKATNIDILSSNIKLSDKDLYGSEHKIPEAQKLRVTVDLPDVSKTEVTTIGIFSSKEEAEEKLKINSGSSAIANVKAKVAASVKVENEINYQYYGLEVTTKARNGEPQVGKNSNSSVKLIPQDYSNGLYMGSGTVIYGEDLLFNVTPNNVIIHTPVVNNANISNVSKFINQKINLESDITYLMLDEQFTITIPNSGTHNPIKGYGQREYNSNQGETKYQTTWGKIKDVRLPFDAYLHYNRNEIEYKLFIKAGTWVSEAIVRDPSVKNIISLTGITYTFTIPVWVTEKKYDIETRVVAENAKNLELTEPEINSSLNNYVATKTIPVEVIGKIYDLRVSSSNDPGWSQIYSWKNKKEYITADEFPFGAQGQNRVQQYNYAPKLGYTFVFDFKTKGRKSNNIDISIQPEGFYFVSKDGKTTQEVDLYYNTTTKNNIKITTADNNVNIGVRLNDKLYKVPAREFTDSTRIYQSKYNYSLLINVGTFAKMNLPEHLRLCYNNFAEYINKLYGKGTTQNSISNDAGAQDTVIASVGHWYAGYRLPASTIAIPKDGNVNTAIQNKTNLTDGYILVKFNIKTKYKDPSETNYDYLRYMGPEALNEAGDNTGVLTPDWTKGGNQVVKLPNGNDATVPVGSVAIFDANLRSTNDSEVAGTH